jgi:hypothetical protein
VAGSPSTRGLLALATAAALAATAGDFAMLWVANARADAPLAAALPPPPPGVLLAGHLAGVLAIPLYAAGYVALARLVVPRDGTAARWIAALGVYGSAVGAAVHGVTGVWIARTEAEPGADPVGAVLAAGGYLVPLWAVVALTTCAGAVVYTVAVARGRSVLARGFALASPLTITAALAILGLGFAWGPAFLVPAAPNLAHVAFFAGLAVRVR